MQKALENDVFRLSLGDDSAWGYPPKSGDVGYATSAAVAMALPRLSSIDLPSHA
jgi:hypothetical protein